MKRHIGLLLSLLLTLPAVAETDTAYDRVSLSVSAGKEIANDRVEAILFAQREGNNPGNLAAEVNQTISQALEKAKRYPTIRIQNQDYSTHPVYRDNRIVAWRVRQAVRLLSDNTPDVATLIGELQQNLGVSRINFAVSPEKQQEAEKQLTRRAIAQFQERAELISEATGAKGYRLVNMNIGGHAPMPPGPVRSMALKMEAAPQLEAGSQRLEIRIDGTIELQAR